MLQSMESQRRRQDLVPEHACTMTVNIEYLLICFVSHAYVFPGLPWWLRW